MSQIGEEKWQTGWCCRDQQEACRIAQASAEKLEHTGPAEKKRVASVPQREQLASMPGLPLPKRNTAIGPENQIIKGKRVKMGKCHTLARERRIRAKAWKGKSGLHREARQIPRRKGRASKKSLPRTSRRKHEQVSESKSSPGRSAQSWFRS